VTSGFDAPLSYRLAVLMRDLSCAEGERNPSKTRRTHVWTRNLLGIPNLLITTYDFQKQAAKTSRTRGAIYWTPHVSRSRL